MRSYLTTSVAALVLLALLPATGSFGQARAGYRGHVREAASGPVEWGKVVDGLVRGEALKHTASPPSDEAPAPLEVPPGDTPPRKKAASTPPVTALSLSMLDGRAAMLDPAWAERYTQSCCPPRLQSDAARLFRPPRA
jgi:hypothetical protein